MPKTNHRQLTSAIGLCALMRLEHGPFLPHSPTDVPARSRPARYEGRCPNCGTKINVGDEIVAGRRVRRDSPNPELGFIHVWCPSHAELMREFFRVDGDVIFRELPRDTTGRCVICGISLRFDRAPVQVMLPTGYLANVHSACVRTTGPIDTPEPLPPSPPLTSPPLTSTRRTTRDPTHPT